MLPGRIGSDARYPSILQLVTINPRSSVLGYHPTTGFEVRVGSCDVHAPVLLALFPREGAYKGTLQASNHVQSGIQRACARWRLRDLCSSVWLSN